MCADELHRVRIDGHVNRSVFLRLSVSIHVMEISGRLDSYPSKEEYNMREQKISTPSDIYDHLYKLLNARMKEERLEGLDEKAEITLRIIEFLERHLEREEMG